MEHAREVATTMVANIIEVEVSKIVAAHDERMIDHG
jgi:hypothetical protein